MAFISRTKAEASDTPRIASLLLFKAVFFAVAGVVLFLALSDPRNDGAGGSDKLKHFLAFYTLSVLGIIGWPRLRGLLIIAVALILFGALIEQLQFYVGRDREFLDWVADTAGVAAAVTPVSVWQAMRWRRD